MFTDPCKDASVVKLTPKTQALTPLTPTYGGGATIWTYVPATVEPAFCETTITCDTVTPTDGYACPPVQVDKTVDFALTLENYTSDV